MSTAVKRTGDKTADVTGDMTIHGVTKPVTLKTTLTHRGKHPLGKRLKYYEGNWVAFSATTTIDHQAFKGRWILDRADYDLDRHGNERPRVRTGRNARPGTGPGRCRCLKQTGNAAEHP